MRINRKPSLSNLFEDIQRFQGIPPIENREDMPIANMAPDDSDDFSFIIYVADEDEEV